MIPKIHALIVDDEEPSRVNLLYALAVHANWEVVGECGSASEARAALAARQVDVVFLDIQMPGESGLALARELCTQAEPPLVIFVTAFNHYAVEAFEVHALDYLLKPFHDQRLAQTLDRAAQLLALHQRPAYGRALRAYLEAEQASANPAQVAYWQQLTVRSVGQLECVLLADVRWMSSAGNYVELHTAGRTILHRQPLGHLETHLDPATFIRVHRATIVRREQCASLAVVGDGSYELLLRCGDKLAVSKRYVGALRLCMRGASIAQVR